jgi:hypothetical protein
MPKKTLKFDFSQFGCHEELVRKVFKAAGYHLEDEKLEVIAKPGWRVLDAERNDKNEYLVITKEMFLVLRPDEATNYSPERAIFLAYYDKKQGRFRGTYRSIGFQKICTLSGTPVTGVEDD